MRVFLLEHRSYESSSTYGVYQDLNKAIAKLREYYIIEGKILDIMPFEIDEFNDPLDRESLIFYGDKYVNHHIKKKREDFLEASEDEHRRLFGIRNENADLECLSGIISIGIATSICVNILNMMHSMTEKEIFENKILQGMESLQ